MGGGRPRPIAETGVRNWFLPLTAQAIKTGSYSNIRSVEAERVHMISSSFVKLLLAV